MSECKLPNPDPLQEQYSHTPRPTPTIMRSPEKQASSAVTSPNATSPPLRPENVRQPSNGLRLAPMPKYHPAVYRSPAASNANTPGNSRPNSRGLYAPRTHVRQLSDVQRQTQEYQRQLLATLRSNTGLTGATPSAPHLLPHDSPGPATPLNLEETGDYLSARSIGEGSPRTLADKMVREEQERRSGMRSDRGSPAISPRC